ncbi:uncharacterized protein LOC118424951 [Branchiostoma floridae]|uniref:Uncharacterized protein LOC118424951 n=1 Tax=Branchiostoma floridae TaxID=7739 RepID=A0A9J7LVW0_BRAFL|nr:uncharacterized protein LOC118424951 [Branchiostoma floridae]
MEEDGLVANQQDQNVAAEKNQHVDGPDTSRPQIDSGCYSIDNSSCRPGQNGGSMVKDKVETSARVEQQDNIAVKDSEAVVTEQPLPPRPCEIEDNTPSFPVTGPPISDNGDTTANVHEKASPTQNIQNEKEELGMPHLDTQHNASGETLRVSGDKTVSLNKTTEQPNLDKLHSRTVAVQEKMKEIETKMCETRTILAHRRQDVDPATLQKIVHATCQEILKDRESLLSYAEMTGGSTCPEPAPNIRKGSPGLRDPKAAHTNLSVSTTSSASDIPSPMEDQHVSTAGEEQAEENAKCPGSVLKDDKQPEMSKVDASDSMFLESKDTQGHSAENVRTNLAKAEHTNLDSTTSSSSNILCPAEDPHQVNTALEEHTEKCPESVLKGDEKPKMSKVDTPESSCRVKESKNTQDHSTYKKEASDVTKQENDLGQMQECSDSPSQREECAPVDPLLKEQLGGLAYNLGPSDSRKNGNKQPGGERQKEILTGDKDRNKQAGDKTQNAKMSRKKKKAETQLADKKENGVLPSPAKEEGNLKSPEAETNCLETKEQSEESVKNAVVPSPVKKDQEKTKNKGQVASNNPGKNVQSEKVLSNTQKKRGQSGKPKSEVFSKNASEDKDKTGIPSNSNTQVKMKKKRRGSEEPAECGVLSQNSPKDDDPEDKEGTNRVPCITQEKTELSEEPKSDILSKDPLIMKKDPPEDKDNICIPSNSGVERGQTEKLANHEDSDDITTVKKVWRQNILPEEGDAASKKENFNKAEIHAEKKGQIVGGRKQEKNARSKRGDGKSSINLTMDSLISPLNDVGKKYDLIVQTPDSTISSYDSNRTLLEDTKTLTMVITKNWMNLKKSSLWFGFLMARSQKEEPPDMTSFLMTNVTGISMDQDALIYNVQHQYEDLLGDADEDDQDGYNPPPEWLAQEYDNIADEDLYLGSEDAIASPETAVTGPLFCSEAPDNGQMAVGGGDSICLLNNQDLRHIGDHSSQHLPTTQELPNVPVLAYELSLEEEIRHYRRVDRGMTVTVLGLGEQVVSSTRIRNPTTLQEHILQHTADKARISHNSLSL